MIQCALGRSGITTSKREGDGATPSGRYHILFGYWRKDRESLRPCGIPLAKITPNLGWCDAPDDHNYNRAVTLPFTASHEKMWRKDPLYDWCLVLDQNYSTRMRNRGSAIFFHLATPDYQPTEGCIAIGKKDMRWLLPHIGPGTQMIIET